MDLLFQTNQNNTFFVVISYFRFHFSAYERTFLLLYVYFRSYKFPAIAFVAFGKFMKKICFVFLFSVHNKNRFVIIENWFSPRLFKNTKFYRYFLVTSMDFDFKLHETFTEILRIRNTVHHSL